MCVNSLVLIIYVSFKKTKLCFYIKKISILSANTENFENIKSQRPERKSYINCLILVLSSCHFLFIHFFITQVALWTYVHCSYFCKNMSTFNDHKIFSLKNTEK